MTKPRTGFLSADRVARRDHRRKLLRRAAGERNLAVEEIGRRLGYKEARWRAIMTDGNLDGLCGDDLAVLGEILGVDVILEELAAARGYRLVRELDATATAGEILSALAAHLERSAAVATVGAAALADGAVDAIEARAIIARIAEHRRALNDLEARVSPSLELRRSAR